MQEKLFLNVNSDYKGSKLESLLPFFIAKNEKYFHNMKQKR